METKVCKRCTKLQPLELFYKRTNGDPVTMCKPCYKKDMAARRSATVHNPPDSKKCSVCLVDKPIDDFNRNIASAGGRSTFCKKCAYIKNLKIKYKIDDMESLLKSVDYKCEICGSIFDYKTRVTTPNIDHNHNCCKTDYTCGKCVRGVLCISCNNAIGLLKDDPEIIGKALIYISK